MAEYPDTAAPIEAKPLELVPVEKEQVETPAKPEPTTKSAKPAINTAADYMREYKLFEKKYKNYKAIEEEVGTTDANQYYKRIESGELSPKRALHLSKKDATPAMTSMTKDYFSKISSADFSIKYGDEWLNTASERELTKYSSILSNILKNEADVEIAARKKKAKADKAERKKKVDAEKANKKLEKAEIAAKEKEREAQDKEADALRKKEDVFTKARGESYSLMVKLGVRLNNPVSRIMDATKQGEVQKEYDNAWGSLQTFIDDPYADTVNKQTGDTIDWQGAIEQIYDDVNTYVNTLSTSAPETLHDAIGFLDREAIEYDLGGYESGEEGYPNIGKLRDTYANQMLNLVNGFIKSALATADPPNEEQAAEATVNEIARTTKDGRSAIFNADTKEFIRYE